jgi:hypothetical protein
VVRFTYRPLYPLYPLDRRLDGSENRSGRSGEEKILAPTGTRTPTSGSTSPHPVAIHNAVSSMRTSNPTNDPTFFSSSFNDADNIETARVQPTIHFAESVYALE